MRQHPILTTLARFGMRMGLDRMRHFLDSVGAPHRQVPVIHVAGTNGKGSVVRMLGSVLRTAGYRVGEYTSPHLQNLNERIHVDGMPISDAALSSLLADIDGARQRWAAELDDFVPPDRVLTYFEMLTAAAFVHFANSELDVAVVEVGLGGRLDATNLVDPVITAITGVGFDHTAQLGDQLSSIAAEKAGVIKPGRPVVTGAMPKEALRVIRSIAAEHGAQLICAETDHQVLTDKAGGFSWSMNGRTEHGLHVGLAGDHQILNASVALAVLTRIADRFPVPDWNHVIQGLANVTHPGRMERLADDLLVDCAHNIGGASSLAAFLGELPRDMRRTLLLGASSDKEPRSMMGPLASQVDRVMTTHCSHPRATKAGELANQLVDVQLPVLPAGPIEDALPMAREDGGLVIVAGSVFLAGAVRDLVGCP